MNINFGTLDEWRLYNALLLVQLLAGTFAYMTYTNKTGLVLYKLLRNNFLLKRMLIMHKLKLTLIKKGNETVHHFALKVQQLVEKG